MIDLFTSMMKLKNWKCVTIHIQIPAYCENNEQSKCNINKNKD